MCNVLFRIRLWHPTPVLLPGKSHRRRSLVGCSPRGCEESDTTERLPFHFSLSCIGEGNGSPLHCSRLENPRDRGAWWAAVYGVTQSRTRLKWLSNIAMSYLGHPWWLNGKRICLPMQETWFPSLSPEDPLEKEMTTHSSILPWEIPWTEGAWQATVHGITESDVTYQLNNKKCLILLKFFWPVLLYY